MDPATAISNAIAAFFQFLCTPAGQAFANDVNAVGADFNKKLGDLFSKIHTQATK